MKTIKNIFGMLMALIAMTTIYSCEDEVAYTPADKLDLAQVYFPQTNSSSIELSNSAGSFGIAIARLNTSEALTVPLTVTGTDGLYTVPASVSFAQGDTTATIAITYDPAAIGLDNASELTLTIGDESYTTDYGFSKYTFSVMIPSPWKTLGKDGEKAIFVEDFMSGIFGSQIANDPYEVEIQENELQSGLFRLVNPFGAAYPYNAPGDWDDSKDWYLEIHAEDSTAVYINMQETGMDWGYGMVSVGSLAGFYMGRGESLEDQKAKGRTGIYKDGIITFPTGGLVVSMAGHENGGVYGANGNGAFMVVMPGVELTDYSIEMTYAGKYTGLDNKVSGVLTEIKAVGADVETIRIAVVAGTDVAAAVEEIRSGNIDSIEVDPKPATVLVPFAQEPVAGTYTIVAVTFDGDNVAKGSYSVEFEF